MIEKRSKLGESQTLQQFSRDVDEIEAWISEKLQTATDESYKDPTNIQVRISRSRIKPREKLAPAHLLCKHPFHEHFQGTNSQNLSQNSKPCFMDDSPVKLCETLCLPFSK